MKKANAKAGNAALLKLICVAVAPAPSHSCLNTTKGREETDRRTQIVGT